SCWRRWCCGRAAIAAAASSNGCSRAPSDAAGARDRREGGAENGGGARADGAVPDAGGIEVARGPPAVGPEPVDLLLGDPEPGADERLVPAVRVALDEPPVVLRLAAGNGHDEPPVPSEHPPELRERGARSCGIGFAATAVEA